MGCFCYCWKRYKIGGENKFVPSSASTTAVVPTSSNGMSRFDDSVKTTSKSSGSLLSQPSIPELYEERAGKLCVFELKELRNATKDFSIAQKIGEGGFGSVYKGSVKQFGVKGEKVTVAVKKLNPEGMQGHKQWIAEVLFLGVVEHPNLVKLLGYCAVDSERGAQRILVYEFMPNKTLDDHLFRNTYPSLAWNIRLQIALGAAEGLRYLHEGFEVQVIYRDFKASNVLLDDEFKPKLSDFGLAREGPSDGKTHITTAVMGTYGYAAPDYVESGHLTAKSDVWSFGVVLYEILTGRRSVDRQRPRTEHKLLDWVKRFPPESARFGMIMDPRLQGKYSLKAAQEVAKLADLCLSKNARERPTMSDVVEGLKQAMQYADLDGQIEPTGEESLTTPEVENKTEKDSNLASAKRRMIHLTKLGGNVDVLGRGRFFLMKTANQA